MKLRFPPPLSVSIPLVLLLFGLLVGVSSHLYERGLDNRSVERVVTERASYLGTHLSTMIAFFLETQAPSSAHREMALTATNADLRTALVLDPSDRVVFSSRYDQLNRPVAETPAAAHTALIAAARDSFGGRTEIAGGGRLLVGAFPFPYQSANQPSRLRSEAFGVVFIVYDMEYPKALARAQDAQRLRFAGFILAGLAVMFLLIFHRMLTSRVNRLAGAARSFAEGKLTARAQLAGADELSRVGRAFDEMADSLQRRDADLRASEEKFQQLADNIVEIFWLRETATGRFLYVSPAFEAIFDRSVGSVLKDPNVWTDAIHPDDRARVLPMLGTEGDVVTEDYRIMRPDGTARWIRHRSFPVRGNNGDTPRVAGLANDVTARKRARKEKEQLEHKLQETQRLESLGVLAGGIAHDFNNLLTGILGNASLARMHLPEEDPAQKYLGDIESVAVRAADLCKQMLAYSGKGRFQVQLLDLNDLVRETTQLLQLSIGKNAQIQYQLAAKVPPIQADATQIRQVVMNLVINASEALDGMSGTVAVRTGVMQADASYLHGAILSPELPAGDYVYLEVSDTGVGMSSETLARIFEPFFTTKFTGRGLGLSAVLGIVRGHEGAMKVYSEAGRGTTFKLLFPVATGTAEPVSPDPAPAAAWRGQGTILLVDDERTVRLVTSRMLEQFGFKVLLAANGAEGVERFGDHREEITCVLMDLTMPVLDGENAYREIRAIDPNARVILMSGFNEQEAVQRFTGKGLAGFVQKPFRPDALRAKLQQVLSPKPSGVA